MHIVALCSAILSVSCGSKFNSYAEYHPVPDQKIAEIVNESESESVQVYNEDYPISLTFHSDGSFVYNIEDYHQDSGVWTKMKDGIHLKAKGKYDYDIYMDIRSADEAGEKLHLIFQDRFTLKNLELSRREIKLGKN